MKSLKLNQIEKNVLSTNEMNQVKGGRACTCSCYWANNGGSSIRDNKVANFGVGDVGTVSEHGNNGNSMSITVEPIVTIGVV